MPAASACRRPGVIDWQEALAAIGPAGAFNWIFVMNRIYRSIWSEALGAYVAAAETTRSKGARGSARCTLVAAAGATLLAMVVPMQARADTAIGPSKIDNAGGAVCTTPDRPSTASSTWTCQVPNSSGGFATITGVPGAASGYPDVAALSALLSTNLGANAILIGSKTTSATGNSSIAIGNDAAATGLRAVAIGQFANAVSPDAVAIGPQAFASGSGTTTATAIGAGARATGQGAIAISASSLTGDGTAAIYPTLASGPNSTAVGIAAATAGNAASAFGVGANAQGDSSTALGDSSRASGAQSVAAGNGAQAIGTSSISVGSKASASSIESSAIGSGAVASGIYAGAYGRTAKATGDYATAIGPQANASGELTTAIGFNAAAADHAAVSIGVNSSAAKSWTVALGDTARATNEYATALGSGTAATKEFATAIGANAKASERAATAVGPNANAAGASSVAIGDSALATTSWAAAVGAGARATGFGSSAIGPNAAASARSALAMGDTSRATGDYAMALGAGTVASAANGVALGAYSVASSTANGTGYVPAGADAAQQAAIAATTKGSFAPVSVGTTSSTRQIQNLAAGSLDTDAVNVSQLKAVSAAAAAGAVHYYSVNSTDQAAGSNYNNDGATGANSLAAGVSAAASSNYAVAIGSNSNAAGIASTAMGWNASAQQLNSIAIGVGAISSASNATAMGTNALASAPNTVAIGTSSKATAAISVVVGASTVSVGQSAAMGFNNLVQNTDGDGAAFGSFNTVSGSGRGTLALGFANTASADGATAVGQRNVASGSKSISMGYGNNASGTSSISIGTANTVSGNNSGAIGDPSTVTGNSSYSVGNNNTISGDNSFVLGNSVTVTNANNVVLGNSSADKAAVQISSASVPGVIATLNPDGSVSYSAGPAITYGNFAGTATGVVSVGAAGAERQIVNVAPGAITATSTDAVNGSQLYAVASAVNTLGGSITTIVNNAQTHYYSVNDGGTQQANYNNAGASGTNSIAAGPGASASANNSVAVGANASATTDNSVALGNGSTTTAATPTASVTIQGQTYNFAGANPAGVVSVGSAGAERQIQNVAAGQLSATSTDAVNGSQLYATNQAINNIQTGGGIKYFHANSQAADSQAAGAESVAIGPQAIALGASAIATGNGAQANGAGSIALGANAITTSSNGIALGAGATADRAGMNGQKELFSNVSVLSTQGGVSVGSAGSERQITNVAGGTQATDAVNVRQLQAVQQSTVRYDTNVDGAVNYNSVTMGNGGSSGPVTVHNVAPGVAPTDAVNVQQLNQASAANTAYTDARINQMGSTINEIGKKAYAGVAAAMAMESAPYVPGKLTYAAGMGYYEQQTAMGVSLRKTADNGRWSVTGGASATSRGTIAFRVGIGGVWD